ncbi:hypothetical protein G3N59_22985 [Paraburkholderia sp. Ac-20340]|uniref:hypothetical protein n=1 Tax=Paraburkholderia sp. Ac-20340 TaxID=2703888 RepID=UPI001981890C|nr:hypothetical protein [Paraburkholderia sp. Ac-20340]MBN3856245.1 hypothetical protein [Paraburkholderia sp. Ac-20340]
MKRILLALLGLLATATTPAQSRQQQKPAARFAAVDVIRHVRWHQRGLQPIPVALTSGRHGKTQKRA